MTETLEQQAEQIMVAMARESWNDSVKRLAQFLAELEAARKVADAAGLEQIAENAYVRVSGIKPLDLHAIAVLGHAWDTASLAVTAAVREYRARAESEQENSNG